MGRVSPVWVTVGVAVLVAVVVIGYALHGAGRHPGVRMVEPKGTLPTPPSDRPKANELPLHLRVQGLSIVQNDEQGNPVWSATSAGELRSEIARRCIVGDKVVWELERGQGQVTLSAGRMEVGWDTGEVRFSGGVTVTAEANRRFTVERARFDPGTRKVIGEGGVGWQWGRFSVSAGTLVVDTVQRKFRLRGGVRLAQE